jgi:hypothetical protein
MLLQMQVAPSALLLLERHLELYFKNNCHNIWGSFQTSDSEIEIYMVATGAEERN